MAPGENRASVMDLETTSESSGKDNEALTSRTQDTTASGKTDTTNIDEYADEVRIQF